MLAHCFVALNGTGPHLILFIKPAFTCQYGCQQGKTSQFSLIDWGTKRGEEGEDLSKYCDFFKGAFLKVDFLPRITIIYIYVLQ